MSDLAAGAAGDEFPQRASTRHAEDDQRRLVPSRGREQHVGRASDQHFGLMVDSGGSYWRGPVLPEELPDLVADRIRIYLNRGELPLPGRRR
jgi:hypothetical protein